MICRIVILILVIDLLHSEVIAQTLEDNYSAIIRWIEHSAEVRTGVREHLGLNCTSADSILQFAVSDSIVPLTYFHHYFDSLDCSSITDGHKIDTIAIREIRDPHKQAVYSPTLARRWNERDSLLLVCGFPFRNSICVQLTRRLPTIDSNVDVDSSAQFVGVKSDWKPMGRPYDYEWGWLETVFCFIKPGVIGNVLVMRAAS